jgi:hypothetical protein
VSKLSEAQEAARGKVYRVVKVMELGLGETYGRAEELVKLNAVMAGTGVRILSYTRSPFGLEFESEAGKSYVVEATSNLREWGVVKTYNGTGTLIRFKDERDQVFPQIYYRVRVAE